jgi:hypothetical protein
MLAAGATSRNPAVNPFACQIELARQTDLVGQSELGSSVGAGAARVDE